MQRSKPLIDTNTHEDGSNAPIDTLDENFQEIQPTPGATTRIKVKPILDALEKTKPRPRKLLTHDQLLLQESHLTDKYPQIIPGTLLNATKGNPIPQNCDTLRFGVLTADEVTKYKHKRSVRIECAVVDCTTTRRIATSDLAQVRLCEECTRDARNTRKRARRALTKALKNDNEPAAHAAVQAIRQS